MNYVKCPKCNGEGEVYRYYKAGEPIDRDLVECMDCTGTGLVKRVELLDEYWEHA